MSIAFEPATLNAHQPWNINQAGEAYAIYNSQSRVSASKPPSPNPSITVQQDTANISAASATLAAATQDESRAARIEALRQSIADGNYTVSSYRVATSIIQSLL